MKVSTKNTVKTNAARTTILVCHAAVDISNQPTVTAVVVIARMTSAMSRMSKAAVLMLESQVKAIRLSTVVGNIFV